MAVLRTASASPFVRKCSMAIVMLGMESEIDALPADTSDPLEPLRQQNPLGKIPTLILDDGQTLFDSRVIMAYLDQRAGGGKLYPNDPDQKVATMRLEALCDGIMDAAISQVYEKRFRAENERSHSWVERQAEKVTRAMDHLEAHVPPATGAPTAGTIALACALGYLDLRFEGAWRRSYPALVNWLEAFRANVPAFDATGPDS